MLNKREKELLLQLLLDKASNPTAVQEISKSVRAKKRNLGRHNWTQQEKDLIWSLNNQGIPMREIAMRLGVRRSQAENMLYSMQKNRENA